MWLCETKPARDSQFYSRCLLARTLHRQFTSYRPTETAKGYREKHQEVLTPARASYVSPQKDRDKATLQQSYDQHLERLGLLKVRYAVDISTKEPQFDPHTGAQEVRGYELASLGRLLCRQIGLPQEEENLKDHAASDPGS